MHCSVLPHSPVIMLHCFSFFFFFLNSVHVESLHIGYLAAQAFLQLLLHWVDGRELCLTEQPLALLQNLRLTAVSSFFPPTFAVSCGQPMVRDYLSHPKCFSTLLIFPYRNTLYSQMLYFCSHEKLRYEFIGVCQMSTSKSDCANCYFPCSSWPLTTTFVAWTWMLHWASLRWWEASLSFLTPLTKCPQSLPTSTRTTHWSSWEQKAVKSRR